jgi:hypothetical protein
MLFNNNSNNNVFVRSTTTTKVVLCAVLGLQLLLSFHLPVVQALRIEDVRELHRDSNSITLEWQVGGGGGGGSGVADTSGTSTTNQDDDLWIGFKIKYFTDKLQYTPVLLKNVNLRKFRLDNLKSNTAYKIQVSPVNKHDAEGPASPLLSVRTNEAGWFVCLLLFLLHFYFTYKINKFATRNFFLLQNQQEGKKTKTSLFIPPSLPLHILFIS